MKLTKPRRFTALAPFATAALALFAAETVTATLGIPSPLSGLADLAIGDAHAQSTSCPQARRSRYRVRIDSAPPQAQVFIGSEQCGMVGLTPWEGKLPKGDWVVIIKKEGHEDARRSINVRRTRRLQETFVPLTKLPDPPKLEVRADADRNAFNAEVWVDGQSKGKIPVIVELSSGRHLVEVRKDGYEAFSQWVEVKEGDRLSVNPQLKALKTAPKTGSVIVEADVPDAEVWVDGNKHKDNTPTLISGLTPGPHIIEVRKEPAIPWKQTVNVESDKTAKVSAQLQATIGGPKATIKVVANVEGATVLLDGKDMGPAPLTIKDVEPGEHLVSVRAKGYQPSEERVAVNAGQTRLLNFNLNPEVSKATGLVKVVSPVPEVDVFIDGAAVGKVPVEKELQPGDHFVTVEKKGYTKFEQKVRVEVGQTLTVTAELKAVGELRVLSDPSGAEVWIDGKSIGVTPFERKDIDVGEHLVKVEVEGFEPYEETIDIEGGEPTIVNAKLFMIDTGPTPEELATEQRNLTTFGARVHAPRRVTLDIGAGYPYFVEGHFTVGAGVLGGKVPWDAGVLFRTFASRSEGAFKMRFNLADNEPFSFAVFGNVGFGSNFIDSSGRNSVFFDAGALASLTGLSILTVTGRAYLNIWTDRHCPEMPGESPDELAICDGMFDADEQEKLDELFGAPQDFTQREVGVRLMASVIVELAFRQRWSAWAMFEGAPFQGERAAYTDLFNPLAFPRDDIRTYFRLGTTYKF